MASALDPMGTPHYFGPYANWAYSPLPTGSVTDISVDSPGSGYVAPVVTIEDLYADVYSGSSPTPAVGSAVLSGGRIQSITLEDGGRGYTLGTSARVVITDPTGRGATASATIGIPAGAVPEGGIRKFVDSLPGLSPAGANNLGQYIPVAVPDKTSFPGSDYYEIALVEYTQQLHSDLPAAGTKMRGYVQEVNGVPVDQPHYLGPVIVAQRDVPVRLRFTNRLPTGPDGDLFLPVDKTMMGAGMGPQGMEYSQNRATVHLHGNNTVWISDGTPHQWTTPAGEQTDYPHGVSVYNVPDMPDAGPNPPQGVLTFYYTNQQSARLMFYHDHAYGITRLNVLAGEAAGYLITDSVEQDLINGTNDSGVNPGLVHALPGVGIPLILQDRTFVDAKTIVRQDPTWAWGLDAQGNPVTGSTWYPHVYMPNQNPADLSGMNAFGRWHYGPWFWPPTPITHPPVANPYYDCGPAGSCNSPWEPPLMPDCPNPSSPGEAFQDTPLVNGTPYPYMDVQPRAYRFRILNAANDRFFNLQLYKADPSVTTADGRTNTEVRMVPAAPTAGFPAKWPRDGRDGGAPDPARMGPSFIQIGTEGGFLPNPVVVQNQPITWNLDQTNFDMGVIKDHALFLGTAERADVIVDFSAFAGQTLILYNDSPAPVPAIDARYDYYTDDPDLTDVGGAPSTLAGYGPNVRTVMQFRVANTTPAAPYDLAALQQVFAKTDAKRGVFEASQDEVIVPQAKYDSAYNASFPTDAFVRIYEESKTFATVAGNTATVPFEPKASHDEMGGVYDREYGRMSSMLGITVPGGAAGTNFLAYPYAGPPVDLLRPSLSGTLIGEQGDGTQIWKITHNGVDTHTFHFHLFNVQLLNRVAWDGALRLPDDTELGWKETVRVNPLQDTILALRPTLPVNLPFKVPNSIRLLDPTMPEGALLMSPPPDGFTDPATGDPVSQGGVEGGILNHFVNFGWEYVYHCHLLAHEEMDMMHAMAYVVPPEAPSQLVAANENGSARLNWHDNSLNATGFTLERAATANFNTGLVPFQTAATTLLDTSVQPGMTYYYRVRADNLVGDTGDYGAGVGFPQMTANSAFSDTATLTVAHSTASVSSGAVAFGDQALNTSSAAQVLMLTNTGDATLTYSLAFGGANPGDFSQTHACGSSIAAGSSCAIDLTFRPTVLGPRSATLAISSNDPFHPVVTVLLSGTGTAPVPATPTNFTATIVNPTRIRLSWTDASNSETSFVVWRSTNGGTYLPVGTVNRNQNQSQATGATVNLNDNSVQVGDLYSYYVVAVNAWGSSPASNTAVVDFSLPAAPSGLTAVAIRIPGNNTQDAATLNWLDNSANEVDFQIQRSLSPTFAPVNAFVVGADTTQFAQNVPRASDFFYRVRARNALGNSAWSNVVFMITP